MKITKSAQRKSPARNALKIEKRNKIIDPKDSRKSGKERGRKDSLSEKRLEKRGSKKAKRLEIVQKNKKDKYLSMTKSIASTGQKGKLFLY